jgi:hypothetical protein
MNRAWGSLAVVLSLSAFTNTTQHSSAHGAAPSVAQASATVAVASSRLGSLRVSTSGLVPDVHAWLMHTITVTNSGSRTVYLQDYRAGQFLGHREVLAAVGGCGYGSAGTQPVVVACQLDYHPLALAPGANAGIEVTLWRGLRGMRAVASARLVFRVHLSYRTDQAFSSPKDTRGTPGMLTVTYKGLYRA